MAKLAIIGQVKSSLDKAPILHLFNIMEHIHLKVQTMISMLECNAIFVIKLLFII